MWKNNLEYIGVGDGLQWPWSAVDVKFDFSYSLGIIFIFILKSCLSCEQLCLLPFKHHVDPYWVHWYWPYQKFKTHMGSDTTFSNKFPDLPLPWRCCSILCPSVSTVSSGWWPSWSAFEGLYLKFHHFCFQTTGFQVGDTPIHSVTLILWL